ncbi:hypothetical protein A2U01_0072012, partial [Trifolium medium]|nr:hypothetical protein [Trifolium medium]
MDMPIVAAACDNLEWSIEAADKETESADVAEVENALYHDGCGCSAELS